MNAAETAPPPSLLLPSERRLYDRGDGPKSNFVLGLQRGQGVVVTVSLQDLKGRPAVRAGSQGTVVGPSADGRRVVVKFPGAAARVNVDLQHLEAIVRWVVGTRVEAARNIYAVDSQRDEPIVWQHARGTVLGLSNDGTRLSVRFDGYPLKVSCEPKRDVAPVWSGDARLEQEKEEFSARAALHKAWQDGWHAMAVQHSTTTESAAFHLESIMFALTSNLRDEDTAPQSLTGWARLPPGDLQHAGAVYAGAAADDVRKVVGRAERRILACEGPAEHAYFHGLRLFAGFGCAADPAGAGVWFEKSAGLAASDYSSLHLAEIASSESHRSLRRKAVNMLGVTHLHRSPPDPEAAEALFSAACEGAALAGAPASYNLGILRDQRGDAAAAVRCWRAAAERSWHVPACFRLGAALLAGAAREGEGGGQGSSTRDLGIQYLAFAANANHAKAQHALGLVRAESGDRPGARALLQKAARQGHVDAQYRLGLLLLAGDCEKDTPPPSARPPSQAPLPAGVSSQAHCGNGAATVGRRAGAGEPGDEGRAGGSLGSEPPSVPSVSCGMGASKAGRRAGAGEAGEEGKTPSVPSVSCGMWTSTAGRRTGAGEAGEEGRAGCNPGSAGVQGRETPWAPAVQRESPYGVWPSWQGGLPEALRGYEGASGEEKAEGVFWLHAAAVRGHLEARGAYALCAVYGEGAGRDVATGVKYLRSAAGGGCVAAMHNLACCLFVGEGVEVDTRAALDLWRRASLGGCAESQRKLLDLAAWVFPGDTHRAVQLVSEGNPEQTIELVVRVASEKSAADAARAAAVRAHCQHGVLDATLPQTPAAFTFAEGEGEGGGGSQAATPRRVIVPGPPPQAWKNGGHTDGEHRKFPGLPPFLLLSTGTDDDGPSHTQALAAAEAASSFRRRRSEPRREGVGAGALDLLSPAALVNRPPFGGGLLGGVAGGAVGQLLEAQYRLGLQHLFGQFVEEDHAAAAHWLKKVADSGLHEGAQNAMGACFEYGMGVPQHTKMAQDCYRSAAVRGLPAAMHNLATSLYTGDGVRENRKEAFHWWKKAADLGFSDAVLRVALCQLSGEGCRPDKQSGFANLHRAAELGIEQAGLLQQALVDTSETDPAVPAPTATSFLERVQASLAVPFSPRRLRHP
ncbi:hypothetical protein DIPPA_04905 [Diplonema papillatum]|nr:hypothetical protein DIPPA_04905 [Diplonema papillatum]